MLWTISRRLVASLVGLLLGWTVFHVVRPVAKLPAAERAPVQISAITLKRLGCSDASLECPVYEMTLRKDGTGTFIGYKNNGEYDGKFITTFSLRDFTILAKQFEEQGFFEMRQPPATSPQQEEVVLEVETNEGERVITTDNWLNTPTKLRVLYGLIDLQGCQVTWTEDQ